MNPQHSIRFVAGLPQAALLIAACSFLPTGQRELPPSRVGIADQGVASETVVPMDQAAPHPTVRSSGASSTPIPDALQSYRSEEGRFSIQFPQGDALFIGQRPSVDGVLAPLPNGITIVHRGPPNFQLSIETYALQSGFPIGDFISDDGCALEVAQGEEMLVDGEIGLLFADTPCGAYGSTRLFLVRGDRGYRFVVETHERYAAVRDPLLSLLASFRWMDATGAQISAGSSPTVKKATPIPVPTAIVGSTTCRRQPLVQASTFKTWI